MIESLLTAFFFEGGGVMELSRPDQLADHRTHMIWEPRYVVGAGFDAQLSKHVTIEGGWHIQDLNYKGDTDDYVRQVFITIKYHPFAH